MIQLHWLPGLLRIVITVSVGTLLLSGTPAFAQNNAATYPDPAVEARTARELLALEAQLRTPDRGSLTDDSIISIALSLARLGRLQTALQVVKHIQISEPDVSNGAPQTRAEVLRLVVRRRCVLGKLDEAKQLIPSITVPIVRADALLALARAYLRRGELESATKTLRQVSPLVRDHINATAYTAYLLARSGDLEGSKRLFARAQAKLTPVQESEASNTVESNADPADAEKSWKDHAARQTARYEREYVARYLLKAGFADEAMRLDNGRHPFLHVALFNQLVKANRFDIILRLAHEDGGYSEVNNLVFLAVILDQRKGDRTGALKLLAQAEAAYRALPTQAPANESADRHRALGDADMRATMLTFLAYGYRELGQEGTAQERLEEAVAGLSPGRAAQQRALSAILPLLVARDSNTPVSVNLLRQVDAEITPHLPLLDDPKEGYNLLRWLVEAQIKAGQFDAARVHLPRLEEFALALIPGASDINDFGSALQVARQWRQIGDEAQAQRLIQAIYEAPTPDKVTSRSRAHALLYHGFIKEGLARLAALRPLPTDTQVSPSIAYWQAKFQPHIFPERILEIQAPRERLQELVDFTRGLTEPIFESEEESELVLSTSGYSSAG